MPPIAPALLRRGGGQRAQTKSRGQKRPRSKSPLPSPDRNVRRSKDDNNKNDDDDEDDKDDEDDEDDEEGEEDEYDNDGQDDDDEVEDDEDDDNDDNRRAKRQSNKRPVNMSAKRRTTDTYGVAARYITRIIDMNWDPIAVINAGILLISLNSDEEAQAEIASASENFWNINHSRLRQRKLYDIFILLCEYIPGFQDTTDWENVRYRLDRGKSAAKTEDNRAFKIGAPTWRKWTEPFPPASKDARGLANKECAQCLAPCGVKWDDEAQRYEFIHNFNPPMTHEQYFPAGLYLDYKGDTKNLSKGLLRSDLMVRAVKTVLLPASIANAEDKPDHQSNRKSKADRYGMSEVTPALLAYAAVGLRYALSSEPTFISSGGLFNYEIFYNDLVTYLTDPDCKEDTAELLQWWNETLFPPKRTNPRDQPSSMVAMLRKQAIERKQRALAGNN
ncbi:hypothetical protein FRC09_004998 [Ceratobasidium sp. 395]|nr:hypothetical protein FRC09_004998 [Ceratobasidium sp. 395]